jgi:hypothetical protein
MIARIFDLTMNKNRIDVGANLLVPFRVFALSDAT